MDEGAHSSQDFRTEQRDENEAEEDIQSEHEVSEAGEERDREDEERQEGEHDAERDQDSEADAQELEERRENDEKDHKHKKDDEGHHEDSEFKPCCKACVKDNRHNRRACVCQVPESQRRTNIGSDGCITCHCHGCHPEDQAKRLKEGSRSIIQEASSDSKSQMPADEALKNGCCKKCMRAFSETRKACICQVPYDVRMGTIPEGGCRICGCKGCHPDELEMRKRGVPPPPPPHHRGRRGPGGSHHHLPPHAPPMHMMMAPMRGMPHYMPAPGYMRDPRDYPPMYPPRGGRDMYPPVPFPYDPFSAPPGPDRYIRRSPPDSRRESGRKRGRSRSPSHSPRRAASPRRSEPDRYRPSPPRHDDREKRERKEWGGNDRDRETSGGRDAFNTREPRDRESRDNRDSRDSRDSRDNRDSRDGRDSRDSRDSRDREGRDNRDNRDSRDRDGRDSRDSRDSRDAERGEREVANRKRDAREFDRRGSSPVKRPRERR